MKGGNSSSGCSFWRVQIRLQLDPNIDVFVWPLYCHMSLTILAMCAAMCLEFVSCWSNMYSTLLGIYAPRVICYVSHGRPGPWESSCHTCFSRFFLEETMRKLELKLDALLQEPRRKKRWPWKNRAAPAFFIISDHCDWYKLTISNISNRASLDPQRTRSQLPGLSVCSWRTKN